VTVRRSRGEGAGDIGQFFVESPDPPILANQEKPCSKLARAWRHDQAGRRICCVSNAFSERIERASPDGMWPARLGPLPSVGGAALLRLAYIVIGGAGAAGQPV